MQWVLPICRQQMGREGIEPSRTLVQRILSPQRLPFRHRPIYKRLTAHNAISHAIEATVGIEPTIGILQTPALPLGHVALHNRAEDGIRTRDFLLGKQMLYR